MNRIAHPLSPPSAPPLGAVLELAKPITWFPPMWAFGCGVIASGVPVSGRIGSLGLSLLADCPAVEVGFVRSDAEPADPGELGVAAVAPAVANALFSATGLRLRQLPLVSEDV